MKGALTILTYPEPAIIVRCEECGREGRYSRAALAARYGWEAALPDVLADLTAECGRTEAYVMGRCRRAVFVDPRTGEPWAR